MEFVSSTAVLCRQPDMTEAGLGPFPVPSYLEVSVDGQKYSQSLKEYDIVGPAVGIEPWRDAIAVEAGGRSPVPDVRVFTTDQWGHQVWGTRVRRAVLSPRAEGERPAGPRLRFAARALGAARAPPPPPAAVARGMPGDGFGLGGGGG